MGREREEIMREYWNTHHSLNIFLQQKKDLLGLDIVCATGFPLSYNKFLDHFNNFLFRKAISLMGEIKDKRILDVGCGTGRWSMRMKRRGAKVTGIDISQKRIGENKKRMPEIDFKTMSITNLKFPEEIFDIVTSVVVLQHIQYEWQKRAISEILRVTKPGGYIILIEGVKEDEKLKYNNSFPNSTQKWISYFSNDASCIFTDKAINTVLINKYLQMRSYFKSLIIKTGPQLQRNPYDYEGLKKIEVIKRTNKSSINVLLSKIDKFAIVALAFLSYPLEYLNYFFIHNYPTAEGMFLFKKHLVKAKYYASLTSQTKHSQRLKRKQQDKKL